MRISRVAAVLIVVIVLLLLPAARATAVPLPELPVLRSASGELHVRLVAAPGSFELGGERFDGMLYDGAYVPPLWRVRPGDVLRVDLVNRLPEMTNLHFHGFDVSPLGNSDNVFVRVEPGQTFHYRVALPPTHHPGLLWFHPHAHGAVSKQIIAGLSGGIVVEGSDRFYPFLRGLKERVLLVKHRPHPRADWQELVSVNGVLAPDISIRPGEAQYWRLGNIGADLFLRVKLDGLAVFVLGYDGHYLARPRKVDTIDVGPGTRVELLVIGGPPGRYRFRSVPFTLEQGEPPLPEYELGTVVSEGPPADVAATEARVAAQRVEQRRQVEALRASPIARRRTFTFSRTPDKTRFFINGEVFDPNRTDVRVPLGDVEEWTIVNQDDQLHNFHIHQTQFIVTEIDGVPQEIDGLHDTFTLPIGKDGKPSVVKVVVPFTDPLMVGRFVFHCHVNKHADKGMMQVVEVVRPGARASRAASR